MHSQNLKVLYKNPVWSRGACKTEVYTVIYIKEMLCLLLYVYLTNSSGVVSGTLSVNKNLKKQQQKTTKKTTTTNKQKLKKHKKISNLSNQQTEDLLSLDKMQMTNSSKFVFVT